MTQGPPPTPVAPLLLPSFAPLLGLPRFLSSLPPSSPAFVQQVRPMLYPSLEAVPGVQQTHALLRQCSPSPAWLLELELFASNPGHTCSRLRRKDEAASKDACHAPAAPPALEPRGGLLHLVAGTLRDHIDNCLRRFRALRLSLCGAEAALSMRACCPSWVKALHFSFNTHSSAHRDSSFVSPVPLFPAARPRGCLAIKGRISFGPASCARMVEASLLELLHMQEGP